MRNLCSTAAIFCFTFFMAAGIAVGADGEGKVTLYLVRHGRTGFNTTGRVQGWSDTPLTESGIQGAVEAGIGLRDVKFTTAYSSDLGRAVSTAEYILRENTASDTKLVRLSGIREKFYGGYEGKTNKEMWQPVYDVHGLEFKPDWSTYPQLLEKMTEEEVVMAVVRNDPLKLAETHDDVVKRTREAIDFIIKDTLEKGGGNALVVSHGGEITTIIDMYAGDDYNGENISNCSVSTLEYSGGKFTLGLVGDTSFLNKGRDMLRNTPVSLYFVTPGETLFRKTLQAEGWADTPLTEAGEATAGELARKLSGVAFVKAYSSDMGRAARTMDLILEANETLEDYEKLVDLRDWGYGGFEGRMRAELWAPIFEQNGLTYDPEKNNIADARRKIGAEALVGAIHAGDRDNLAEDWETVSRRADSAVRKMVEESLRAGGGNVLVLSHDNQVALMAELFAPETYSGEDIPPGSVIVLEYKDGKYTLRK